MPSSRNSKKLLKNPNNLLEAAEHLRPRGSYDPLPPPGGYPLPAYIRRKFSFAPQLPNISMLSLMPDFASSSMDLNLHLDKSKEPDMMHGQPNSLHVHCSSPKTSGMVGPEWQQKPQTFSFHGSQQTFFASSTSRRPVPTADANGMSNYSVQSHKPEVQPSRGHRRLQGRNPLHVRTASSLSNGTLSESSSTQSHSDSSALTTSMTSISLSCDELLSNSSIPLDDDSVGTSQVAAIDAEPSGIVRRLAAQSPNLFGSFCIIDLQLEGKPVRCTSHDMLPIDLASDEVLFLDEGNRGTPYQLRTIRDGERDMQTVALDGALMDINSTSARPSHRFIGEADLTAFMQGDLDDDEDVWLTIAYEEMEKAGLRRPHGKRKANASRTASPTNTDPVSEVIQSLHRDYFVIGVTGNQRDWSITMVSPTLSASKELRRPDFLDFGKLASRLSVPQRFVTRAKWRTPGLRDKLYCVPMSGPKLVCWLCFLVHRELPDLWPDSSTRSTEVHSC
ncbi:MAG: hypothetical protein Q9201_004242 [Fulgogasparrea decipioides]